MAFRSRGRNLVLDRRAVLGRSRRPAGLGAVRARREADDSADAVAAVKQLQDGQLEVIQKSGADEREAALRRAAAGASARPSTCRPWRK